MSKVAFIRYVQLGKKFEIYKQMINQGSYANIAAFNKSAKKSTCHNSRFAFE